MTGEPEVIILENMYAGHYGYFYPRETLYSDKDGKVTKQFYKLAQKHSDLHFYDGRIFLEDKTFKGLLSVEGTVIGNTPMVDLVEIRDFYQYRIVEREGN